MAKPMPQIFPVPTSKRTDGFSLVEVLVAIAVVALMVAAAASSVASSRSAGNAAMFYREVYRIAEDTHARAYGFTSDERAETITATEQETITGDEASVIAIWELYTVRAAAGDRRMTFSLHGERFPQ
jgi:prepilin-type N-terminal cleavage/methylation domain-containing protein